MRKFTVVLTAMSGWSHVGQIIHVGGKGKNFPNRREAKASARREVDFGSPHSGMASLIAKWIPRKGWRVVEIMDWHIWPEE